MGCADTSRSFGCSTRRGKSGLPRPRVAEPTWTISSSSSPASKNWPASLPPPTGEHPGRLRVRPRRPRLGHHALAVGQAPLVGRRPHRQGPHVGDERRVTRRGRVAEREQPVERVVLGRDEHAMLVPAQPHGASGAQVDLGTAVGVPGGDVPGFGDELPDVGRRAQDGRAHFDAFRHDQPLTVASPGAWMARSLAAGRPCAASRFHGPVAVTLRPVHRPAPHARRRARTGGALRPGRRAPDRL